MHQVVIGGNKSSRLGLINSFIYVIICIEPKIMYLFVQMQLV